MSFSLGSGAPTNAAIDDVTGIFTWQPQPDQSPSTNDIPITVTDDGTPNLSDTKTVTIVASHVLEAGGVVRVDPSTHRGMKNVGDSDAVIVVAGGKDGYVGRDGRVVGGGPPAGGPPGAARSS